MNDKTILFNNFINKANKIHKNKYLYTDAAYKDSKTKIGITCVLHGIFYQCPTNHLSGQGCPTCKIEKNSLRRRLPQSEFIKKVEKIHNNIYDYSFVEYKGYHHPITIICKKHGKFIQKANNHLYGAGCPTCVLETSRISRIEKDGNIYKICSICNEPKEENDNNFYKRRRGGFNSYCKICDSEHMKQRIKNLKLRAIEYKGGKCVICGYNKCPRSLDFHHLDPSKKEFSMGERKTQIFEKIKIELDKCVLLCKNCHGEVHDGMIVI